MEFSGKVRLVFFIMGCMLFGIYGLIYVFFKEGSLMGGALMLIGGIVLGIPGGMLVALAVCPTIGKMVGDGIFYPTAHLNAPPRKINPIRGMINRGEIKPAVAALTDILEKHPFDAEALKMMIEVLMDEMQEYESAGIMMKNYLSYDKLKPSDDVIDILMRYADCCEILGDPLRAEPFFEHELTKKYSEASIKAIRRRLEAMKAEQA
jgi:hypothetical protein